MEASEHLEALRGLLEMARTCQAEEVDDGEEILNSFCFEADRNAKALEWAIAKLEKGN